MKQLLDENELDFSSESGAKETSALSQEIDNSGLVSKQESPVDHFPNRKQPTPQVSHQSTEQQYHEKSNKQKISQSQQYKTSKQK